VNFLENLKKDFQKIAPIPDEEWAHFANIFHRRSYKKGEFFVLAGNFSTNFGFVENGLLRYFYTTFDGKEFNQAFKIENDLLFSYTSVLLGEPSNFSIQALEDTTAYVGNYQDTQVLYKRHSCWQELGRKIAEMNFIVKTKKEEQFLLYDAQERYENFARDFSHLLARVPQMHIASYLGVSPETLNRIIKKSREK
jgi:CRP-like cAMP-binding protein